MAKQHSAIENTLLKLTANLLKELKQDRALRELTLDADLEHQLGIGSLEKAELFRRIETEFDVQLDESLLVSGECLRDLTAAITIANPYIKHKPSEQYPELPSASVDLSKTHTLVEALATYADKTPDRPHIYLLDAQGQEKIIDYGGLYTAATAVAKGLMNLGLEPKQTVAIMLPSSEEFFYAFFGVLIAGGVPVPIYPPFRMNKLEEYMRREATILNNAETPILIAFEQVKNLTHLLKSFVPSLKHVTLLPSLLKHQNANTKLPKLSQDDAALIQYTSGSTGDPKGVLLTHYNLLENIKAYGEALDVQPSDVLVSWLPLYHDMGLIGAWLGSLYYGVPVTIMSPITFLTHPEKWLWAIHYHRATLSVAPNFAYELCLTKIPDKKLVGLDLSSWRMAMNGAEAIYPNTIHNFYEKFKHYGLKKTTQCPAYGLAENAVCLCLSDLDKEPSIDIIDRTIFDTERRAVPIDPNKKHGPIHEFVNCGKPIPRHEIRIVDNEGTILPERTEGHLHFRGPSMMQGYYRHPKATAKILHDGWYDSGDFAYIADGNVYITGREKDVIIKAGRNLYPQEVEEIVGNIEDVRKGCTVAFGVRNSDKGTEQFVVVAETHATSQAVKLTIQAHITEQVAANMGIPPDEVLVVPPGSILKTSSGKLQRSGTKQAYLQGKLIKRAIPAKLQIARMLIKSLWEKTKRAGALIARCVYSGYLYLLTAAFLLPLFPIIRFAPKRAARTLLKGACRLFLRLAFCPITVKNTPDKDAKPRIYIANHSSYMDSVILIATMPTSTAFVGKKELTQTPLVSGYFKACRYLSVDRMDFTESLKDVEKINQALDSGDSIMIFPEGTFAYAIGVRPFKLGAFNLAVKTQTPLYTMGVMGARQFLGANTKLFSPSKLTVCYGKKHQPQGEDFNEVIRLRDATREDICRLCEELPINLLRAGPDET